MQLHGLQPILPVRLKCENTPLRFSGEGVELIIVRSGDVMTIYPHQMTVTAMLERLHALPAPSEIEIRETDLLRERQAR